MPARPRSAFRRTAAAALAAATLLTGEALAQSLPTVRVPTVDAVPVPTVSAVPTAPEVVEVPSAPAPPPVPRLPEAPAPVPKTPAPVVPVEPPSRSAPTAPAPTVPRDRLPATPATPVADGPKHSEAPSRRGGSAPPQPRSAPGAQAPATTVGRAAGGAGAGSLLAVLAKGDRRADAGRRGAGVEVTNGDRVSRSPSQRRLRRELERHGECLGELSTLRRRVVLLRVGVDKRRPLSRREVARRLDVSPGRVADEERAALRQLRAERGGCSRYEGQDEGFLPVTDGLVTGVDGIDADSAARGLGALVAGGPAAVQAATVGGRGEVAGVTMSGSETALESSGAQRREAATRTVTSAFQTFESTSRGSVAATVFFGVLAFVAVLLLARELRRR